LKNPVSQNSKKNNHASLSLNTNITTLNNDASLDKINSNRNNQELQNQTKNACNNRASQTKSHTFQNQNFNKKQQKIKNRNMFSFSKIGTNKSIIDDTENESDICKEDPEKEELVQLKQGAKGF
jgi:exosome complex RNA-binding protein Rrp42 (RNase PH superfamily)